MTVYFRNLPLTKGVSVKCGVLCAQRGRLIHWICASVIDNKTRAPKGRLPAFYNTQPKVRQAALKRGFSTYSAVEVLWGSVKFVLLIAYIRQSEAVTSLFS